MALDLFRVSAGLNIENVDGTDGASVITSSGAPGGDAGVEDAASVGTIYLRQDASASVSAVYQKITDTNNAADWVQSASKDFVDAAINGLSWREPVLVLDDTTYANIAAAVVAANVADLVDGVTIVAGDRLLFTDLTSGNDNVYIVSGSTGAWTFTEDTNLATDGDALLVQEGTKADQQWVFDGTIWVQFGGASAFNELAFIRTFIGKTASGSETPSYSSQNIVTNGESLETAIGGLDAAIGDRTYTEDNFVTDGETITASIDALDIAIAAHAATTHLVDVGPVTGITTITTIDSVLVDDVQAIKWFVTVFDEGDTDQKAAVEVYAVHDGTASGDATLADWNESSKLKVNGNITGLKFTVSVSGTGAAQVMNLQVEAGDTVTVNATRVEVIV